jgi:hypothetical protein
MLGQRRFGKLQTAALVVIALVMGANLISPAVAHVTRKLNHLYKHLDPRYINVGEKATSAATADTATNATNLGGSAASTYLQATDIRVDGTASDVYIPNFNSATFVPLLSKSFTAPSNGFLFIVGSVSWESSVDPATLMYRLRLDSTPVTSDPFAYMADAEADENQETGSASAVVPVTAGAHTVHLDGRAFSGAPFIIGRDISILFAESGSGVTIPARSAGRATGSEIPSQQ